MHLLPETKPQRAGYPKVKKLPPARQPQNRSVAVRLRWHGVRIWTQKALSVKVD